MAHARPSQPNPPAPHGPEADRTPFRYTAQLADTFELAWQERWAEAGAFRQPNPGEAGFDASKPKFYCLDMFPYPSGAGLHVGHPEGYTATDIISRARRMQGFNVLHPMGWDAFGLPAEQYAIQTGVHPAKTTRKAIDNFRRQLTRFGFSYDWSREFATIDPGYYRWTQWIFLKLYDAWYDAWAKRARPIAELVAEFEAGTRDVRLNPDAAEYAGSGDLPGGTRIGAWAEIDADMRRMVIDSYRLAYVARQTVNWCPKLGTALANEEVIDGKSERGGYPVLRKPMRQWMFRITAYADRLVDDLAIVDWPESTRTQQAEWIGRSEGAEIAFPLLMPDGTATGQSIRVFTTRPDTICGATYMVVAPEHPVAEAALEDPAPGADEDALRAYIEAARNRSDVERQEAHGKTGVFTGYTARNPATGEAIPVWTSDYVLMGYGTGAIMAVPAHDERDFEFATTFGLPIRDVVYPAPIAAMSYFALHATPADASGGSWHAPAAAFVAAVAAREATPDRFAALLGELRSAGALRTASPKHEAWRKAIDDLGCATFEEFRERFATASHFARGGSAFCGAGFAVNSAIIEGMATAEAKKAAIAWLEQRGLGSGRVNYRLRDWLFSRQRYWGEPFPIVFDEAGNHYPTSPAALPVELPDLADFAPEESDDPRPLLAKAEAWLHTTAGEAGVDPSLLAPDTPVTREANTMPGWAGSCWYYLRYCDAHTGERFASREAERYWMGEPGTSGPGGVDLYIGGAEHAVLHLLYARFWHKVLFDLGEVGTPEPFAKLFHQGLILSYAYRDSTGRLVPVDEVEKRGDDPVLKATGERVEEIVAKMSKTLKNVVNPDDIIAEYGADTFRLYEMYIGPLEASQPWRTTDMIGLFRFLRDVWRLVVSEETGSLTLRDAADLAIEKLLHRTIAKVGGDIDRLAFNTAIAAMIEWKNAAQKAGGVTAGQLDRFARLLCPFAPHLCEELWSKLGGAGFCSLAAWPGYDEAMLHDDTVEIPVQLMGKVRTRIAVPTGADAAATESAAMADARVADMLKGKTVRKVIVVPGRMVNFVAD